MGSPLPPIGFGRGRDKYRVDDGSTLLPEREEGVYRTYLIQMKLHVVVKEAFLEKLDQSTRLDFSVVKRTTCHVAFALQGERGMLEARFVQVVVNEAIDLITGHLHGEG